MNMLKTSNKTTGKTTPKATSERIAVIKNGHTDAELDEMEERWLHHQGTRLTLADVIAIEQNKQVPEKQ